MRELLCLLLGPAPEALPTFAMLWVKHDTFSCYSYLQCEPSRGSGSPPDIVIMGDLDLTDADDIHPAKCEQGALHTSAVRLLHWCTSYQRENFVPFALSLLPVQQTATSVVGIPCKQLLRGVHASGAGFARMLLMISAQAGSWTPKSFCASLRW